MFTWPYSVLILIDTVWQPGYSSTKATPIPIYDAHDNPIPMRIPIHMYTSTMRFEAGIAVGQ